MKKTNYLVQDAKVTVQSQLTINPNVIYSLDLTSLAASGSIVVLAPETALQPTVTLEVTSCLLLSSSTLFRLIHSVGT